MRLSKLEIGILCGTVIFFVAGGCFYPFMPEVMATHWNFRGQADGYAPRLWGVFLIPLASIGLALLLVLLPRIDPLKANIEKFKRAYYGFVAVILFFLLYVYVLSLLLNLGVAFDIGQLMLPAVALVFYCAGVLVARAKRNWFIGIRTPWTLSSDIVWDKTHRLGGKLFRIAAAVVLLGFVFPDWAFYFILGPVILVTVFTVIYSYVEYQRQARMKG